MSDIVHVQSMQSNAYLAQLQEQLTRIENLVEGGKVVTIILTDNDRHLSLVVSRDGVVEKAAPIAPSATRKAPALADNNSLSALATNTFTFDVGEADRQIKPAYVQAQMAKSAKARADTSLERPMRSAPGVPVPKVSYDGDEWVLADDCTYAANDGFIITAKGGFKTDLASIPRILWPLIASFELSLPASIFHDLIYRWGGRVALPDGEVSPDDKIFSRQEADDLFLELMTRGKDVFWKRNLAYLAVHWFGESSWHERPTA